MFERLGDLLDMYKFGTGSIRFCLNDMRAKLDALGDQELVDETDDALSINAEASEKHYDWKLQERDDKMTRRRAAELDVKIDRTLGQVHSVIEAYAKLDADNAAKEAGQKIQSDLFARGISPIVHSTFEEQHQLVDELLDRLESDYVNEVKALGLEPMLDTLADYNEEFGDELNVTDREPLTYDEVQAARSAAEDAFHRVLFKVVAAYVDDPETLADLLRSVEDQQERISRHMRRRGSRPEVDPETGEVVDNEEGRGDDGGADDPTVEDTDDDSSESDEDVDEPVITGGE